MQYGQVTAMLYLFMHLLYNCATDGDGKNNNDSCNSRTSDIVKIQQT